MNLKVLVGIGAAAAYLLIGFCCVACRRLDLKAQDSIVGDDFSDAWFMLVMWPLAVFFGTPRALISLCGGRWVLPPKDDFK